ncbi:MAG: hypothetical protein DMG36_24640 [Acidobacteria bacterium]|nr:MAG: hypothetical protein DMG36_24640 [Acidobacteriota bacterium]
METSSFGPASLSKTLPFVASQKCLGHSAIRRSRDSDQKLGKDSTTKRCSASISALAVKGAPDLPVKQAALIAMRNLDGICRVKP